jgi:SAM-dependent methyltransferase
VTASSVKNERGCSLGVSLARQFCPVCLTGEMGYAGQTVSLQDVIQRWESQCGAKFREVVLAEILRSGVRDIDLLRCDICHFSLFTPVVVGSPEFYADVTPCMGYHHEKWEFQVAVRDILRRHCRCILDVGCGPGEFLDQVRQADSTIEVMGYEHNPPAIKAAREKGHVILSGDFSKSVVESGRTYDAVALFQIIEHLEDPMTLLMEVRRVLAPGGIVIVAVPDAGGPVRHFSNSVTDLPPHHVSRWEEQTFLAGVSKRGFKVLQIRHEPLPDYHWDSYLPAMVQGDLLPWRVGVWMNARHITQFCIKVLRKLGVRALHGVRGHSLYVVLGVE